VAAAHRVWASQPGTGGPLSAGLAALEGEQVGPREQAIYAQVCAAIYAQSRGPQRQAANGINHHMKNALAYARKHEPEAQPAVVGTWSLLLQTLYGDDVSWWVGRHLRRAIKHVQPAAVTRPVFMAPGPWRHGPAGGVITPDGVKHVGRDR